LFFFFDAGSHYIGPLWPETHQVASMLSNA
jgi:hypothetical protein